MKKYFANLFAAILNRPFGPFAQIVDFNTKFQVKAGDLNNLDWNGLERQVLILEEEFNEVKAAIKNRDVKELRDGTSDVIVVAVGLAHRAGIPLESDLDEVYRSNMTKLVRNLHEEEQTLKKYSNINVGVYFEGSFPAKVAKSASDQNGTDGKFYPKGKILKSVAFVEPTL